MGKADISYEILSRYSGLSDISEGEWESYFPNNGKPWRKRDLQYLATWWGKDDVLSLSYALGRPPWNLQRAVCQMRARGIEIVYLREDYFLRGIAEKEREEQRTSEQAKLSG